jgi:muramoyltetrapeptide carboxypeptidase LdcA involved in peptidoglycan recycling
MQKPRALRPGDTVVAVSLSWGGPGMFPHRYAIGKEQFMREFGVNVVESRHALSGPDWLARHPKARAADLMEAFADPSIHGIISTIGGDDSIRLLPHLDLDVIADNPKVFLGYSDTTVSHLACYRAGLVSFYGPSVMAGFAENGGMFRYMVDSLRRTCFSPTPVGDLTPNTDGWTAEHLDWSHPDNQTQRRTLSPSNGWRFLQGRGRIAGPLFGGCIEVLDWLRGTSVWPEPESLEGVLLFLETSEEAPSPQAVTRMLRSLAAVGVLERARGLLFGRPGGQLTIPHEIYDDAIRRVVVSEERLHDFPIVTGMDFGHTDPMFVLPYGVMAEIDCDEQRVRVLENAVV